jgi:hypothetical protein
MASALCGAVLAGSSVLPLLGVAGCSGADRGASPDPNAGRLSVALEIADGVEVGEITYTLTQPDGYRSSGTLALSPDDGSFRLLMQLPAADGYELAASAITSDAATCYGSAAFDIRADRSTPIGIVLRCVAAGQFGSFDASGVLNVCPAVQAIVVRPLADDASFELRGTGSDPDHGPRSLRYAWTATSGTLAGAATPNATLLCTSVGSTKVTLTVTDGDDGCRVADADVVVLCHDVFARGTGGAPDAGGNAPAIDAGRDAGATPPAAPDTEADTDAGT